jgi:hypothetical protein
MTLDGFRRIDSGAVCIGDKAKSACLVQFAGGNSENFPVHPSAAPLRCIRSASASLADDGLVLNATLPPR